MLGSLNQRGDILARTTVPDGAGGIGESWSLVGRVWLKLEPQTAEDLYGPDAREARVRVRMTAQNYSFFAAGQRVVIGARTFAVHALLSEGRSAPTVMLVCEELP